LVELDHRFLILAIAAGHLVRFAVFMAFIAGLIAA
jgi:hypothetical protein